MAGRDADSGIRRGAAELARRHEALNAAFAARDGSAARDTAWRDAAQVFRTAVAQFYEPYRGLAQRVRDGDRAAMDEAARFLEADPWCFRSGYVKEELMSALANAELPADLRPRLQAVVLHRLSHRQTRLLRPTGRLAANVWDARLAERVAHLVEAGTVSERDDAAAVLLAVEQKQRTLAGRRR